MNIAAAMLNRIFVAEFWQVWQQEMTARGLAKVGLSCKTMPYFQVAVTTLWKAVSGAAPPMVQPLQLHPPSVSLQSTLTGPMPYAPVAAAGWVVPMASRSSMGPGPRVVLLPSAVPPPPPLHPPPPSVKTYVVPPPPPPLPPPPAAAAAPPPQPRQFDKGTARTSVPLQLHPSKRRVVELGPCPTYPPPAPPTRLVSSPPPGTGTLPREEADKDDDLAPTTEVLSQLSPRSVPREDDLAPTEVLSQLSSRSVSPPVSEAEEEDATAAEAWGLFWEVSLFTKNIILRTCFWCIFGL